MTTKPDWALPLFVPADRPERFAKAAAAGADAVVIDLEDAVATEAKDDARRGLGAAMSQAGAQDIPFLLRINAAGTPWHDSDLAAARQLPLAAIMLAKAESGDMVKRAVGRSGLPVIALIETAAGLALVEDIAQAAARLAFGSIDFAADLGCAHERDALLLARSRLVLAARLAGNPPPIDGVTTVIKDEAVIEDDARHAVSLGFGGKLLIHPAQVGPARRGFAPADAEVAWARRIVEAARMGGAAVAVDGAMVDAPVVARAERILRRLETVWPD